MRKLFFVFLYVFFILPIVSCDLLERPAVLKTINVDGDLTDWGNYLYSDSPSDTKDPNGLSEIYQLGILADETNLYIASKIKLSSWNSFVILVDIVGVNGVKDLSTIPNFPKIRYENGDIDIILAFFPPYLGVQRIIGGTGTTPATAVDIAGDSYMAFQNDSSGQTQLEISIPLTKIGITSPEKLNVKAVGFTYNPLYYAFTQEHEVYDFCPNQDEYENATGIYVSPLIIYKTITNPKR